jgi:hypothetical protein
MNNQNQKPDQNQETDILILLDYFKNGIKKIFTKIGNLFTFILNAIIWFCILLKRYFILTVVCIILFSILGYYNKIISPPSYNYEMVLQPNYNSTKYLYQLVDSYNQLTETEDPIFKNIKQIKITPVKSFTNDLTTFFNIINNINNNGNTDTDNKNDTIFSRQYKIEDFRKNIAETDYSLHTIFIKSSVLLSPKEIKDKIISPIETEPFYSQLKNSYLKSIETKEKYYKKNLQRIDTLLLALADRDKSNTISSTLSIKGDSRNNVEDDLLNRSVKITEALASLETDRAIHSNVIKIVSEPQLVANKSKLIKRNTIPFIIYGFLFSVFLIFLIQFIKYLNKFEKEHS